MEDTIAVRLRKSVEQIEDLVEKGFLMVKDCIRETGVDMGGGGEIYLQRTDPSVKEANLISVEKASIMANRRFLEMYRYFVEHPSMPIKKREIAWRENVAETCVICLEDFKETSMVTLTCGHCLHFGCVENLLDWQRKCPMCRADIQFKIFKDDTLEEDFYKQYNKNLIWGVEMHRDLFMYYYRKRIAEFVEMIESVNEKMYVEVFSELCPLCLEDFEDMDGDCLITRKCGQRVHLSCGFGIGPMGFLLRLSGLEKNLGYERAKRGKLSMIKHCF